MTGNSVLWAAIAVVVVCLISKGSTSSASSHPSSSVHDANVYAQNMKRFLSNQHLEPATLHPEPATPRHMPALLRQKPATLRPESTSLRQTPTTLRPESTLLHHKPATLRQKPATLRHQNVTDAAHAQAHLRKKEQFLLARVINDIRHLNASIIRNNATVLDATQRRQMRAIYLNVKELAKSEGKTHSRQARLLLKALSMLAGVKLGKYLTSQIGDVNSASSLDWLGKIFNVALTVSYDKPKRNYYNNNNYNYNGNSNGYTNPANQYYGASCNDNTWPTCTTGGVTPCNSNGLPACYFNWPACNSNVYPVCSTTSGTPCNSNGLAYCIDIGVPCNSNFLNYCTTTTPPCNDNNWPFCPGYGLLTAFSGAAVAGTTNGATSGVTNVVTNGNAVPNGAFFSGNPATTGTNGGILFDPAQGARPTQLSFTNKQGNVNTRPSETFGNNQGNSNTRPLQVQHYLETDEEKNGFMTNLATLVSGTFEESLISSNEEVDAEASTEQGSRPAQHENSKPQSTKPHSTKPQTTKPKRTVVKVNKVTTSKPQKIKQQTPKPENTKIPEEPIRALKPLVPDDAAPFHMQLFGDSKQEDEEEAPAPEQSLYISADSDTDDGMTTDEEEAPSSFDYEVTPNINDDEDDEPGWTPETNSAHPSAPIIYENFDVSELFKHVGTHTHTNDRNNNLRSATRSPPIVLANDKKKLKERPSFQDEKEITFSKSPNNRSRLLYGLLPIKFQELRKISKMSFGVLNSTRPAVRG